MSMLGTPDEELARLAAGGRLDCFEELIARHRNRVYRICYRSAGDADDAEDWAQDCFVRAYRKLGHYDPALPFAPWLLRLVANTCINNAKSRLRRREHQVERGETEDADELWEVADEDDKSDPLCRLILSEEESRARSALAELPPHLRVAVTLRYVEDLSFRELSEVLGVPLQTAATRVRRALLQVRENVQRDQPTKVSRSGRQS